jgi:hypothetical protein
VRAIQRSFILQGRGREQRGAAVATLQNNLEIHTSQQWPSIHIATNPATPTRRAEGLCGCAAKEKERKMSWFFGGNNSKDQDDKDQGSSSYDTPSPYQEHAYDNHSEFIPQQQYSSSSSSGGSLQEQLMAEQQKLMVQQVMFKLTEQAFDSCVQKPSSSLSSSEQTCIAAVASKYLEAGEFMIKKISSKNH